MPAHLTRRGFVFGAPLALAACSAEPIWAPDEVVKASRFSSGGPSSLTLYTVKNVGSDNGAHTSLLVDASQRIIFDPAGSFKADSVPERNDVLFGISPPVEQAYVLFHARPLYYVVKQKVAVPPAVAEQALQLSLANGAVPKANCTRATSGILRQLPGFTGLSNTWFPNNLADAFGQLPGVTSEIIRDDV